MNKKKNRIKTKKPPKKMHAGKKNNLQTKKKLQRKKKPLIIDAELVSKKLSPKSPKAFSLPDANLFKKIQEEKSRQLRAEQQKKEKEKPKTIQPQHIHESKPAQHIQEKNMPKEKNGTGFFGFLKRIFDIINIFKKKNPEKIPLLTEKSTITTVYDSIYAELKQKKIVKVSYLAKKFNMKKNKVLELAKNFEETGKIEIIYPMLGSPRLMLKEKGEMSDETD
jgi:hypothetical protein